jgi:hypothetical protein
MKQLLLVQEVQVTHQQLQDKQEVYQHLVQVVLHYPLLVVVVRHLQLMPPQQVEEVEVVEQVVLALLVFREHLGVQVERLVVL